MGIVLKKEHMMTDSSAMMSLELRRHCNHFFIKKSFLRDVVPQLLVQPSSECIHTDTLNYDANFFLDKICPKMHHKQTATPPSNVIAITENHSLPPLY